MKTLVRVICCVLMCAVLCGCATTAPSPSQSGNNNVNGNTSNIDTSKDQLAKKFYTAFFTSDINAISECCPTNSMEEFVLEGVNNAGYGSICQSASINLTNHWKGSASEIRNIEEEYQDEAGISIFIEEGYIYDGEVTLRYKNGEIETRGVPFKVIVAKINGKWYAFPADL